MDVADIFLLARNQSHVNSTQFSDGQLLIYINIVKNNFWSYMVSSLNEDYDWDIFTLTTTVVDQDEYTIPAIASDTAGVKKIKNVSINYDGLTYDDGTLKLIKAKEITLSNLKMNWNYYKNNQDADFPIYYIADNSIFIAPIPKTAVASGIEIKGIKKIPDYTASTVEADMVIPIDHHDILVQGILPYIFKAQGKNQESITEKQEYIRQRTQATEELADRNLSPLLMDYPIDRETPSEILTVTLD